MIKLIKKLFNYDDVIFINNNENYLPILEIIKLHKYKLANFLIDEIGIKYSKDDAKKVINIINNKSFLKRSLEVCNINSNDIIFIIKNFDNPLIFSLNSNFLNINKLYNGKTLLMYALEYFRYNTIIFLINNDIDIKKKDNNNNDCGYYLYNFINKKENNTKIKIINKIYKILKDNIDIKKKYDECNLEELIKNINKIEIELENDNQMINNFVINNI